MKGAICSFSIEADDPRPCKASIFMTGEYLRSCRRFLNCFELRKSINCHPISQLLFNWISKHGIGDGMGGCLRGPIIASPGCYPIRAVRGLHRASRVSTLHMYVDRSLRPFQNESTYIRINTTLAANYYREISNLHKVFQAHDNQTCLRS